MTNSIHLIISGEVQGVYYRDWTVEVAKKYGVNGWVRNLSDGTVEAVICGEEKVLAKMIKDCWTGSEAADVKDVMIEAFNGEVEDGFVRLETK